MAELRAQSDFVGGGFVEGGDDTAGGDRASGNDCSYERERGDGRGTIPSSLLRFLVTPIGSTF